MELWLPQTCSPAPPHAPRAAGALGTIGVQDPSGVNKQHQMHPNHPKCLLEFAVLWQSCWESSFNGEDCHPMASEMPSSGRVTSSSAQDRAWVGVGAAGHWPGCEGQCFGALSLGGRMGMIQRHREWPGIW